MITKLQDTSIETLSGGATAIDYDNIPGLVLVAQLPAADHIPFLA